MTEHERFKDLVGQVTQVNEMIYGARRAAPAGAAHLRAARTQARAAGPVPRKDDLDCLQN